MKLFTILSFCIYIISFPAVANNDSLFDDWLKNFRSEAMKIGIAEQVLDEAFLDIKPLERVIELDRKQPETTLSLDEYLEKTVTSSRIKNGKLKIADNKKLLAKISKKYSVPARVIVALWGIETNYGSNTGNFNVIQSLATLAYDGRRSDFFRTELLNALKIMQSEQLATDDFEGSWAGAFGQCQFMPSSFLKYAVDGDGDGKKDIWNNESDIFSSVANYLHTEGWNINEAMEEGSNNFNVLKKWNNSRYFITAVGNLSTEIGE